MNVFTYLRRIDNIRVLEKFVCNLESYNPTLLKYVSLRTLNLDKKINEDINKKKEKIKRVLKIAEVVEKQINKIKYEYWNPSEVVSVMNFLSNIRFRLNNESKKFFKTKIKEFDGFIMYDIIQMLNSVKNLDIEIDKYKLKLYMECNIELLLKNASITNIYSLLSVLSIHNIKLSSYSIDAIIDHCVSILNPEVNFKELTNLYNSFSRQVDKEYFNRNENTSNDGIDGNTSNSTSSNNENKDNNSNNSYEDNNDGNKTKVEEFLEILHNNVLRYIENRKDDLEGIVDVIDANVIISKNIKECNDEFLRRLRYDEIYDKNKYLFERIKYHLSNVNKEYEPKDLRVLLRSMVEFNLEDPGLLSLIVSKYNKNSWKYSLQGLIDVFKTIIYFQQDPVNLNFDVDKWRRCVNSSIRIMGIKHVNDIFIDSVLYELYYGNTKESIDSLINTGIISDRELLVGFLIMKMEKNTFMEKMSLKSLKYINDIKSSIKNPNCVIFNDNTEDVGNMVEEVSKNFNLSESKYNFIDFCNFNFEFK